MRNPPAARRSPRCWRTAPRTSTRAHRCEYLSTLMDGTVADEHHAADLARSRSRGVVGRMRFTDLPTVGGKLFRQTHFAPLLRMQGVISGIALDVKRADGARMLV